MDDIPDLECYEKIAHEKAYSNAKKRKERNELIYQGVSPDEVTLVSSADELGYTFLSRENNKR